MITWIRRIVASIGCAATCLAAPGDDVVEAFARAAGGAPLRYVAIGGSITQGGGPGWAGDWLREEFPESLVSVVNSGMSGTGSALGIFRVERDVLAHQPDLVAIEYCVNDGGLSDEAAIRYLETMVVRLKSSPRPPAIMIVEAAARTGVNLSRHRRVARHHDLLEIDFQAAVDAHLRAENLPWSALFGDDVHPNRAGHAFYADVMRRALEPLARRAREPGARAPGVAAPAPPLSEKPLLLDARMVPLQGLRHASGDWRGEPAAAEWWSPFFQGLLSAERPGAALRVPFRGTAVGLLFTVRENHGSFFVGVDGGVPTQVFTDRRHGFGFTLVEPELPPGEHVLDIVLPQGSTGAGDAGADPDFTTNGPVKLGYVLVAGETRAGEQASPRGPFDIETLRRLRFETVPAASWSWTGPFPVAAGPGGAEPVDAIAAISRIFLPGIEAAPGEPRAHAAWAPVEGAGGRVDFRALTGSARPGVVYAFAEWFSERGGAAVLSAEIDYYARLWLNGEPVLSLEGPHRVPVFLPVTLRPGANVFLLKLGAGSGGFSARLRLAPH